MCVLTHVLVIRLFVQWFTHECRPFMIIHVKYLEHRCPRDLRIIAMAVFAIVDTTLSCSHFLIFCFFGFIHVYPQQLPRCSFHTVPSLFFFRKSWFKYIDDSTYGMTWRHKMNNKNRIDFVIYYIFVACSVGITLFCMCVLFVTSYEWFKGIHCILIKYHTVKCLARLFYINNNTERISNNKNHFCLWV